MKIRYFPFLAGLATLALTALVAWFVHVDHKSQKRERLAVAAERIEKRVANEILALQAIRGVFIGGRAIPSRQFFADMIAALPQQGGIAGVQGFGFALASPPDDGSAATDMVAQGYGMRREPWPETDQAIRYPIVLLEPIDERNRRVLNYDMFSDPVRREAMLTAESTGKPAITRPVRLKQEGEDASYPGFLIYVPIYARDGLSAPGARRTPEQAIGFVYAPVRASELVGRVLSEPPALNLGVEVYSEAVLAENLLHRGNSELRDTVTIPIRVADRVWNVVVGDYAADWRWPSPAFFVALIGIFLSGALTALLGEHLRSVEATEKLAIETRKRVEQQEVLLGESQHRIKNSIARKLALFRMTARETKDRESLIRTFESRMQSMAQAQELLLAHPGGGLSIQRLLEQELGQWQGASGIGWGGPDIRLEGSQLQALGLIIHEMMTNSLKYGALAKSGMLDIRWSLEAQAKPQIVQFTWHECSDAPEIPAPVSGGFGSRLIRMMVEGQLGGSEQRTYENGELVLAIRFPLIPRETPAM